MTPSLIFSNKYYFHTFRYLIILLIALIITHLLSYNQVPFVAGYSFPTKAFLIVSLFGAVICTANWLVYHQIQLPPLPSYWKQLTRRLIVQLCSTFVFYIVLYWAIVINWFGQEFIMAHFLKYLLVCSTIIGIEFLLVELVNKHQLTIKASAPESLYIRAVTKDVRLPLHSVLMFSSNSGVVKLYSKDDKPLITKYSSLDELEQLLPKRAFFRVNRQSLLNRDIVKSVKRKQNRTLELSLDLNGHDEQQLINISRYKRKEFLTWLQSKA